MKTKLKTNQIKKARKLKQAAKVNKNQAFLLASLAIANLIN